MADDRATDRTDDESIAPPNRPVGTPNGEDRPRGDGDTESEGWGRIPIDIDGIHEDDRTNSRTDDAANENDVDPYGPEPSSTPIEAGDPSLENALFVLLGAILMLAVVARLVSLTML